MKNFNGLLEEVLSMMTINDERYIQTNDFKMMTKRELNDLISFTEDIEKFKEINAKALEELILQ